MTSTTTTTSVAISPSEGSLNATGTLYLDLKPTDSSISQLDLSMHTQLDLSMHTQLDLSMHTVDRADSFCSLTSSVMGPPTYRPPNSTDDDHGELGSEDLDLKIRDIKCKIESEMKEQRRRPPPVRPTPPPLMAPMLPVPPNCVLMPPPMVPMDVDQDNCPPSPIFDEPIKRPANPTVVLDPASQCVVPIAALPWHQRYALAHPYFRNMSYLPPQMPFMPPPQPTMVPPSSIASLRGRVRGRFRSAPLVCYIPGGFNDVNRHSSFSPVDFSSELMSYVRMRKEMLKMDLREKIRLRKEELLRSQRAAFEVERGGRGGAERSRLHQESEMYVKPSGKYQYYYREGRERGRDMRKTRDSSPPPKTPREEWQSRMHQRKDRRSSSSSSSDDEGDGKSEKKSDSRRKWIAQRKAAMLAKSAALKERIKERSKLSAAVRDGKENIGAKSPAVPHSYRIKNESPDRDAGRRSLAPRTRGLREWKNTRDY